jgi:hypothetical protein
MKRKYLAIGIILFFVGTSIHPTIAQNTGKNQRFDTILVPLPPPTRWMKTLGGMWSDSGSSVQQTTDGGYIITGSNNWSYLTLRSNAWLIKIDGNGDVVWEKSFVEPGIGSCVQQTSDGGYIIVGNGNTNSVWLIKTDANGSTVWTNTFTGTYVDYYYGYTVQQTTDGGYIIIGMTSSEDNYGDFWLLKTDNTGHQMWEKTFGGSAIEDCSSGQQTTDGGYILAGYTYETESGYSDVWLVKIDGNGEMVWNKTFGGPEDEWGHAVQQTTDGGYIITGETIWEEPSIFLIKTDSNGNRIWEKIFEENRHDYANAIQQTTDDGYIIIGQTYINDSNGYDILLMRTDSDGNKSWHRTFDKAPHEWGRSVKQTTDKGYILLGDTYLSDTPWSDIWLIKTDSQGKSQTTSFGNLWFEWLFQRFSHAVPILRQLVGY